QAEELRPAVAGVVLIGDEPFLLEGVRDTLDALAGEAPGAGDLRDGQRLPFDGGENAPAGGRLAGRSCEGVAGRGEGAVDPEDLHHELAERLSVGRSRQFDSMLSCG